MNASEDKLTQELGNVAQFIIAVYQRTYLWALKECQHLWAYSHRACPTPLSIWHKGNGDVELGVATLDEVSYTLDLIRQPLELQLYIDEGTN